MIGTILATGLAAAGVGFLAVPAARRLMLGDVEYDWLAGELDLDSVDADGCTVRCKTGTAFRVIRIRGVAYDAKIATEQERLLKIRATANHAAGEGRCTVSLFGVKRRRDIGFDADWPSPTLAEIAEAERHLFRTSFYVEWFLILSSSSAGAVAETCAKVLSMLADYDPRVMARPEDPTAPCPLTGFLNHLVCGDLRHDLPPLSWNLSGSLPASDLRLARDGVVEAMTPIRHIHRIIGVRSCPEVVQGRIIAEVMAISADIEVSHVCIPWDRDLALAFYKRKAIEQGTAFIGNPQLEAECEAIIQLLTEGNTTLFRAHLQFTVRTESEAEMDAVIRKVCDTLGRRGILYSVETVGAGAAWFGRLPGRNPRHMLRPLNLTDRNVAGLWAWPHSPSGLTRSPFGERPVRYLGTPSGQAYAFQFHVSDRPQANGNFLVFAPAGAGKSTLIMHLLGGLAKFAGVRSYVFDSKEGARFMIETLGGVYQGYENLALNPLDVGDDTPQARHRVLGLLKAMAAGAEHAEDDDQVFAHTVELAFKVEPPERTLNTIHEFAFASRTPLRRAFARWITDSKGTAGMYAHVFNAPHDSLGSFLAGHFMVGINMNEALNDPVLGPPVVAHISAAISKSAAEAAKGFVIFIDEAAKLLQNEGFRLLAAEMYREYRKLNGCVGLAFQDPAALFRSGMAEAFLENTTTLFFFPNSNTNRQSLEPFNLNDEQIEFILNGPEKPDARHVLVVKRDAASGLDESTIIDVDLRPLGDALRFYRAGVDANKHLAELKRTWGDQWPWHV